MTKKSLSQIEIKKIRKLAKQGKSLNEISNLLKVSKTTVYYWYTKTVGKKIKPIIIDRSNDFKIGEFIGAFAGDGNFYFDKKSYHYRVTFVTSSYEESYSLELKNLISHIFGKEASRYKAGNKISTIVYGKDILKFLKEYLIWEGEKGYTVRLRCDLSSYSKTFLKGFIRGLFDTDGNVNKKKAQITVGSISKHLILQVSYILKTLNLDHSFYRFKPKPNKREFNCIYIYNRKNLQRFNEIIGFTNPIKKERIENILRR